jgi:hypothetical protein
MDTAESRSHFGHGNLIAEPVGEKALKEKSTQYQKAMIVKEHEKENLPEAGSLRFGNVPAQCLKLVRDINLLHLSGGEVSNNLGN